MKSICRLKIDVLKLATRVLSGEESIFSNCWCRGNTLLTHFNSDWEVQAQWNVWPEVGSRGVVGKGKLVSKMKRRDYQIWYLAVGAYVRR